MKRQTTEAKDYYFNLKVLLLNKLEKNINKMRRLYSYQP